MKFARLLVNIYTFGCFFSTSCVTIDLLRRYFENEDTPALKIKTFRESPKEEFPAITLCIQPNDNYNQGTIYDEKVLSKHRLNYSSYRDMLMGKTSVLGNGMQINFEEATIKIENYINKFRIQDNNDQQLVTWKYKDFVKSGAMANQSVPMNINYQDPTIICFSHHANIDSDAALNSIDFYFDLPRLRTIEKGQMSIYLHYKNSFIRNMQYYYKIRDFQGIEQKASNNYITFNVNYVSVIRTREDANQPCDPTLKNDDEKRMQTIWELIGCVPPYWMLFYPGGKNLIKCSKASDLQQAIKYFPLNNEIGIKSVNQRYAPPCHQMRVLANSNMDRYYKEHIFKMKFRFRYLKHI